MPTQLATFGAGCFWGVEVAFRKIPGVVDAAVGYAGGEVEKPTYKQVCTDTTGHAEVVQVAYDPAVVSYDQLLDVFFRCHNPTQFNRQGPDYGSQYRSVIFCHSPEQMAAANAKIAQLNEAKAFPRPIVTVVEPEATFWRAEEYHQQYHEKNGGHCHF